MKVVIQTLKAEKKLILISFFFFLLSCTIGIVAGIYFGDQIQKFINQYLRKIFESILKNSDNSYLLFLNILKNNLKVYLIVITLGTLTFGLISLLVLLSNGFTVGAVVAISAKKIPIGKILLLILPHGIFEIAAFLIGSAASAVFLEKAIMSNEKPNFKIAFKNFAVLAVFGAILVVVAAFIEGFLTVKFAK